MAKICKKLEVRESTVRHDGVGADGANGGGAGGALLMNVPLCCLYSHPLHRDTGEQQGQSVTQMETPIKWLGSDDGAKREAINWKTCRRREGER